MTEMDRRTKELRATIFKCIRDRLNAKLEKLEPEEREKRAKLEADHEPETWLAAAARQVTQIQLATHIVKPIHSSARGTDLHVTPQKVNAIGLVGTHSLAGPQTDVAVRNAAALYVYNDFLAIEHDGQPLWKFAVDNTEQFQSALSDDPTKAKEWCQAFTAFAIGKGELASHSLAKQLYFPLPDGDYHLLAPLFPTTLIQEAYRIMSEDRFGETAKSAHEAQKEGKWFSTGYRDYPSLAIQRLGGENPQNVSQLVSKRRGANWLLASLPPSWTSSKVRPPLNSESVFPAWFGRQRHVKDLTAELRRFLEKVSHNNLAIRRHRAVLVQRICDEAHQYSALVAQLPAGWSADARCRLHECEKFWLDPLRAGSDEEFAKVRKLSDWIEQVSHRFGNWLNDVLASKTLLLGENEQSQWKEDIMKELAFFQDVLGVDND